MNEWHDLIDGTWIEVIYIQFGPKLVTVVRHWDGMKVTYV